MKKRLILIGLILSLCLVLPAGAAIFSDVDGHWAMAEIQRAFENKLVNGDGDGSFRPDDRITRGEFIKILAEICADDLGETISNESKILHWSGRFADYLSASYLSNMPHEGVLNTVGLSIIPGQITPEIAEVGIERWEMAYLIWGKLSTYVVPSAKLPNNFSDAIDIEQYSNSIQDSIINCNAIGVLLGDEEVRFQPKSTGTRAEAVTMLNRLQDVLKQIKAQFGIDNGPKASFITTVDETLPHPKVQVTMKDGGKFVMELYPEYAPKTVTNFLKLVESGFYNGLNFHRIVEGFVAQGGDPSGNGTGGSNETIIGEFLENGFSQNLYSHQRGVVSMARSSDPNSASSQFFICYGDASFLDGSYAAFGKVIEGMEVVDSFTKVQLVEGSEMPQTPIIMESVTVLK